MDVFTLDMDVGFIDSPMKLVDLFTSDPQLDVLLQVSLINLTIEGFANG